MKVFRNELVVHRHETFTLSKRIETRNGAPYIVSSELMNPYFLITVSDKQYEQEGRYVYKKWLNLKDSLRFYITNPIDLKSLGYEDWNAVLPAGYEGDETSGYANVAVFCLESDGVKTYKYWKYANTDEDDFTGSWEIYNCRIITYFPKSVTSEWNAGNYYYSILLVSGIESDGDEPISPIDTVYPILKPTRIYVDANLIGGRL